jgi:predicted RND superfamily exporter protein
MKSNILACILSSLAVVLALFYATYRRILPTLLLPLIIASGVALALGLAGLLLPSIHFISFAFMALIIGLGTDYSIHLYDRFHTERTFGRDSQEALRLAVVDTGHGLFTAATTTAVPFLVLCISDVRALFELGLLVGLGVIFSLYTTLIFLPPLLLYMERRFPISYRPIPGFGLRYIWRLTVRWPRLVVALSLLITFVLAVLSFRTTFDGELKNLQPQNSEAFLAQGKIERHLNLTPKQMMVAIDGAGLNEVLQRTARVEALAVELQSRGEISVWSGVGRVFNSQQVQEQISRAFADQLSATSSADELKKGLSRHGFDVSAFRTYTDGIAGLGHAEPVPA